MTHMPAKCGCGLDHEPLLSIADACRRAARHATPIACIERLPLGGAAGRILAEDIHAEFPMPLFDQSAMDGYAVAAAAIGADPAVLPVTRRILAGDAVADLPPGTAARIFTGAPLPAGADAVVMQEQATRAGDMVTIPGRVRAGDHVRRKGEDIAAGERLLFAGTRLDSRHIGLMAAQGLSHAMVRMVPKVAVVSTGNELRQAGDPVGGGAIYDSNRPMLMALAQSAGLEVIDGGCLPDNAGLLAARLKELAAEADLIVSSGGASVGEEDNSLKSAISAGARTETLRIAMKPGKPAVVGSIGTTAYLGLPGNPVSAFVSWMHLGRAMIAAMEGARWQAPAGYPVVLERGFAHKQGRTEFVPARITCSDNGPTALILGHGVSAHLKPLAQADGLVEIAAGQGHLEPGDKALFHPFRTVVMNQFWGT